MKKWNELACVQRAGLNGLNLVAIVLLSCLSWGNAAHAATPSEEERLGHCPEGAYSGAASGAKSFTQDPYVWFVSREFAKRFCMPDQFIDDSLQGALAVAARLVDDNYLGRLTTTMLAG